MKRKGFTLVELLIVVAILGALAAVMTVSSGSSIAKAKATTIAHNLRVCTTGSQIFYLDSADDETNPADGKSTEEMLNIAVPNWTDFNTDNGGKIQYAVSDSVTGHKNWGLKVTLSGTDKDEILTALKNVKGFSTKITDGKYSIIYKVFDGTVARVE